VSVLEERAAAVRALAGLMRAGVFGPHLLRAWEREVPAVLAQSVAAARRRAELGERLDKALEGMRCELGDDARALAGVVRVHLRLGGNAAAMLDGIAASIDERGGAESAARAAGAGAALSARLVSALPLLFVPFLPLSKAPLFDAPGILLLVTGGGLALAGIRWVGRLVPQPPSFDDPVAWVADLVASVLDGGVDLASALDFITEAAPDEARSALRRAKRMVALGASWPGALERLERPEWRALAGALRHAGSLGLPAADVLRAIAAIRRSERRHGFEAAMRKAPVVMVVPLVCCVLPSFVLLGIAPFLRGLALG
jgi:tight adherence protein B